MQLAGMDGAERTVAVLVHEWASGNNTTLADHHLDADPPSLTAAEAARALVTTQAFAVGGGVSKPFNFVSAAVTRWWRTSCATNPVGEARCLLCQPMRRVGSVTGSPLRTREAPCRPAGLTTSRGSRERSA
jgi:hypothetical protein